MSKLRDTRNGRPWTPDRVRQRIRVGVLVTRLNDHALGNVDMTPTQIKAAEILLRKAVPDLRSVEHSGTVTNRYVQEFSDAELANIAALAARGSAGATEETDGSPQPGGVH